MNNDALHCDNNITVKSTVVKTSVDQPTTLAIGLPEDYKAEISWKKNGQPIIDHPVLPDGSLYIINTDLHDAGEYTVIVNKSDKIVSEKLELTVVDPRLPSGYKTLLV